LTDLTQASRFQVSLRTGLAVTMLLCLLIGLLINFHRSATLQNQRVMRLVRMGNANLFYDYQLTPSGDQGPPLPFRPSWLGRLLGRDYAHQVVEAILTDPVPLQLDVLAEFPQLKILQLKGEIDQETFDKLSQLKNLQNLNLTFSRSNSDAICALRFDPLVGHSNLSELTIQNAVLSDHHFRSLGQCAGIEVFRLLSAKVELEEPSSQAPWPKLQQFYWSASARGKRSLDVEFLQSFPHLKTFVFQSDQSIDSYFQGSTNSMGISTLDDTVFRMLAAATELEVVSLYRTGINGEGLQHLSSRELQKLELPVSHLNDQGLMHLQRFPALEFLELGSTDVSDHGMVAVAQLSNLQTLSIRDTQVTDLGLHHLEKTSNLRHLRIRNTKITAAGIDSFQQHQPDCFVDRL